MCFAKKNTFFWTFLKIFAQNKFVRTPKHHARMIFCAFFIHFIFEQITKHTRSGAGDVVFVFNP